MSGGGLKRISQHTAHSTHFVSQGNGRDCSARMDLPIIEIARNELADVTPALHQPALVDDAEDVPLVVTSKAEVRASPNRVIAEELLSSPFPLIAELCLQLPRLRVEL